MKKSKILKLLVSALSLCLIIGAMVGITAMAETDPGDSKNPEIFSYNVSYSDSIYLYYAVKAEVNTEAGETIYLQICTDAEGTPAVDGTDYDVANPDKLTYKAQITDWYKETIYGEECYVFVTNGVAAKDINKYEYVKAVIVEADGVTTRESKVVKYSVLSYLYQRLYSDNMIAEHVAKLQELVEVPSVEGLEGEELAAAEAAKAAAEAENEAITAANEAAIAKAVKDNIRRELYLSLISYGAAAQELLLPENGIAEFDSIRDAKYYNVNGDISIIYEVTGALYSLPAAVAAPEGKVFYGWKVIAYVSDGTAVSDGTVVYAANAKVYVGADVQAIMASPVFDVADAEIVVSPGAYSVVTFDPDLATVENGFIGWVNSTPESNSYLYVESYTDSASTTKEDVQVLNKVADGQLSIIIYATTQMSNANRITVEFDICRADNSTGTNNLNKGRIELWAMNKADAACGKSSAYIGGGDTLVSADNKWAHIRVEIYDSGDNIVSADLYVNGTKATTITSRLNGGKEATTVADMNGFKINLNGAARGDLYFDNMSFTKIYDANYVK